MSGAILKKCWTPSSRVAHFKKDGNLVRHNSHPAALVVWTIFSSLSLKHQAINLGQGFMGFPPADFVKAAATEAVNRDDCTQYAPTKGNPQLRQLLAERYSRFFQKPIDPETEVLVTAGANEGIFASMAAFLNPGDEVILMEPYFDQYLPNVTMNGGVPVYLPIRPPPPSSPLQETKLEHSASDWYIDMQELEAKITPRTKFLILNTPHNPIGKVFSTTELMKLGRLAQKHDFIILSDEVYDTLVFKPHLHERIAAIPEFWDRSLTLGSVGKTFGVTGWRVGWLVGPEPLIKHVLAAQSRIVFCTNAPLQQAAALCFTQTNTKEKGYFDQQLKDYEARKAILTDCFKRLGLTFTEPGGTYFILVDAAKLNLPKNLHFPQEIKERGRCFEIAYWMCTEIGVTCIPVSEFYSDENAHLADTVIRFAFCKSELVLRQAVQRLEKLKDFM